MVSKTHSGGCIFGKLSRIGRRRSGAASADLPQGRGRPGGAESRARILDAAGELFADRGIDGVSTRELAKKANVNIGAINYHFGGKEALYHETLETLLEDTGPIFRDIVDELYRRLTAAKGAKRKLTDLTHWYVRAMFRAVLGNARAHWQMAFLLREFHNPSQEFPRLLQEKIDPMHNAVGVLIGEALGTEPDSPDVKLKTLALINQIMSFGACRAVVCARVGWDDYSPDRIDEIANSVAPSIIASLGLPSIQHTEKENA